MKYKLDKKGSNKISKILIITGLALILAGPGKYMLNILGQLHGAEVNNNIVNSVIVNDKQYSEEIPSEMMEQENINQNETEEVGSETYTPKYDITKLQESYPDAWGILEKADGTAFPIVQTNSKEEENFYLKHTLNGEYSPSGTVFLDYQNDKNMENQVSRLWGHNLYGENMFGDLTEYQNQGQSFYDQNKTYTLYTEKGVYQLEVFAALEEDASTQNFDYNNQDEFLNDMNTNKAESNFTSNTQINPNDQVVIFACCTDDSSDLYTNDRFSVYTKVTPIYEYNLNNSKTL